MSVQRWTMQHLVGKVGLTLDADSNGEWVTYSDHARIVAEAGAAVFAFHPEWTVTGMCDSDCLACRRLTELITEREKGYEEGKADAEQEHAAAWDRATFDSTAYEQGKRDAAEEARAAERRHWEARFRNAEAAHAAALLTQDQQHMAEMAEAVQVARTEHESFCDCYAEVMDERHEQGRQDALVAAAAAIRKRGGYHSADEFALLVLDAAAAPRTLTADDPGYHSQRCLHCDHIRATHTLTAHGCIGHALPGRPGADCPCAEFIHDGEAGR